MIERRLSVLAALLTIAAGCSQTPLTLTPKSDKSTSPVIRESIPVPAAPQPTPATGPVAVSPESSSSAPLLASAPPSSAERTVPLLPPTVPAGTLYVCAAAADGQPKYTAIEYVPKVKELCAKHPEMGVCQYEREACRASGGRVFDARGAEITRQTEAEYDRKVMRVRFRAG